MGKANFSDDFKRNAAAQITERGYSDVEVSKRLGVSQNSLYMRKRKFSKSREQRRQGCRDSKLEARTGEGQRGARHHQRATAYFARPQRPLCPAWQTNFRVTRDFRL